MPEMSGFSYNGVHCEELGLYYIPTKDDLWFPDPEYDVYDEDIDWRHGGVYYTSKAKVRKFTIKCYFEEIDVAKRQKIKEWVRRDTAGKLVFDDMPFVYWNVRPGKIPAGNWYIDNNDSHSGTVTLTFTAHEPFGYLTRKYNNGDDDGAENYCNLINQSEMPAYPSASDFSFDVYNPGTEPCGLSVEIAGTMEVPFRLFNEMNSTFCVFNSLPTDSVHLFVHGDTGMVKTYDPGTGMIDNGFAYHDKGVVRLDPNRVDSGIGFSNGTMSGTEYQFDLSNYQVSKKMIGAKITLSNNSELRVVDISEANNRVWCTAIGSVTLPETGVCSIQTLNHITIQQKNGAAWITPTSLTMTEIYIDYNPRAM